MAAIALVILWTATRKWRRPKPVTIPEDLESAAKLSRERTRRVVIGALVIVVAAVAMAVPQMRQSGDFGSAASKGPTHLTITPPAALGSYRLMTGTQADRLSDTSTTDSQLAQELAHYSADHANVDFMAGARMTDARVFNPGSVGGEMRCGRNNVELLCGWADSGTIGGLVSNLTNGLSVQRIASLTREFRAAAEH